MNKLFGLVLVEIIIFLAVNQEESLQEKITKMKNILDTMEI
jgi:hypothetical protein